MENANYEVLLCRIGTAMVDVVPLLARMDVCRLSDPGARRSFSYFDKFPYRDLLLIIALVPD